jgi:hypothetical protein
MREFGRRHFSQIVLLVSWCRRGKPGAVWMNVGNASCFGEGPCFTFSPTSCEQVS